MKRALFFLGLLLGSTSAIAQTPSPAKMGITSTTVPEVLQVLDHTQTWVPIGTVDPTTHTFTPIGGGGSGSVNEYATHALLLAAAPTAKPATIVQTGYWQPGVGRATYAWDPNSYCPLGGSSAPVAADNIACILPAGQSVTTAGRYLLQVGNFIDVTQSGWAAGGQDNSPYVTALMNILAPTPSQYWGGYDVTIPPIPGQANTSYYFTQELPVTAGVRLHCGGGPGPYNSISLVFAAGVHGVHMMDNLYTNNGGGAAGTISGCRIVSQGYGIGYMAPNPGNLLDRQFNFNGDQNNLLPVSILNVGDGILVTPGNGGSSPDGTVPAVPPGTYVTASSGAYGAPATLSNSINQHFNTSFAQFNLSSNNFQPGDKITLGNNTFTFVSSIGAVAGNVLIGGTPIISGQHLVSAIMGTSGGGTNYIAPPNTPNVFAQNLYSNFLKLWATTPGVAGNLLPATYTPTTATIAVTGPSNGLFSGGTDPIWETGVSFYQMPASQKFTAQTISGSPTILVTGGPRRLMPGDLLWSDAFPFGSTVGRPWPASVFTQSGTNNFVNGDQLVVGATHYRFVTVLSVAGDVLIGANFAGSAANLVASITQGAGNGSTYISTPTTTNFTAAVQADGTIRVWSPYNSMTNNNTYVSTYTPAGTPAGSWQAGTLTYENVDILTAFHANQNATVSHPAGAPGQFWVLPAGIKRDTTSNSENTNIWQFPIGLEMSCSATMSLNCTVSHDERNSYQKNFVGRWVAGSNAQGSTSIADQMVDNLLMDIFEGETGGSYYYGTNMETPESGAGPYGMLMNCGSQNITTVFGGYTNGGFPGCAGAAATLLTPTPGGAFFLNTLAGPIGAQSLYSGPRRFQSGTNSLWCFSVGVPDPYASATTGLFGFTNQGCGVGGWTMTFNTTLNNWSWVSSSGTPEFYENSASQNVYYGFGAGVRFPSGVVLGSTELGGAGAQQGRLLQLGRSVPNGAWHLPGDASLNGSPVTGGTDMWVNTPSASTTLSEELLNGTTGAFTADITTTNMAVSAIASATPVFTGGSPGTIAGLNHTLFPVGTQIMFTGAGAVPTGLSKNVTYVIVRADDNAATIGLRVAAAIDITSNPLNFTGSGSGVILATEQLCAGSLVSGGGVAGSTNIVSLPGGATHGCSSATGTYVVNVSQTAGMFTPVFTAGSPSTISGLTAATFTVGTQVTFYNSNGGSLPSGLSFNTPYVIAVSSSTVAQIAKTTNPTTPIQWSGSGSGGIVADNAAYPVAFSGNALGTPGTVSGLTASHFTLGSQVTFYNAGGGAMPTGLSFNTPYVIQLASSTVAQLATVAAPTVPLTWTQSYTPFVVADSSVFTPAFTGGAPSTVSGLTAATFPVNSLVAFADGGSAVLPTGLALNTPYAIFASSSTVAQLAAVTDPTTPLSFTGAGSGTIIAEPKMTSGGQFAVSVAACPVTSLPAGTPVDDVQGAGLWYQLGAQASCVAGSPPILTLQAAALNPGFVSDTINWTQWRPAAPISNDIANPDYTATTIRSGSSANKDLTGRIALVGGTATYTLVGVYASPPDCVTADVTTPANANSVLESITTLTFTGIGTDTIKWVCAGRN